MKKGYSVEIMAFCLGTALISPIKDATPYASNYLHPNLAKQLVEAAVQEIDEVVTSLFI